jgi:hypothetical protein
VCSSDLAAFEQRDVILVGSAANSSIEWHFDLRGDRKSVV